LSEIVIRRVKESKPSIILIYTETSPTLMILSTGIVNMIDSPPKEEATPPYKIYNIGNNKPVKLMDFIVALENAIGIPLVIGLGLFTWKKKKLKNRKTLE
jgi:hypothetical protein